MLIRTWIKLWILEKPINHRLFVDRYHRLGCFPLSIRWLPTKSIRLDPIGWIFPKETLPNSLVRTNGLSKQKILGIMHSTPLDFHKFSPTHPNFWEKMRETFLWGSVGWFHLWSGFAIITWNNPKEKEEKPYITKSQYLWIFPCNFAVLLVDPRRFTQQSNVLWPRDQ